MFFSGLDIPTVHAVINYEIPCNVVDYVHRAGRTARAGRSGHVVSIVTEMDVKLVLNIEKKIGKFFELKAANDKHYKFRIKDGLIRCG